MIKFFLILFIFNSLLFSLTQQEKQTKDYINNQLIANNNPNKLYDVKLNYKSNMFTYAYDVEFKKAGNKQQVINNLCSSLKESINKGRIYKMIYRNKYSKKLF